MCVHAPVCASMGVGVCVFICGVCVGGVCGNDGVIVHVGGGVCVYDYMCTRWDSVCV
jgi:hypothetical protein